METRIECQHSLCSVCRGIILVEISDASKDLVRATGQSFEVFREAVKNKCIICSVVWQLSRQYRHIWSESPEVWEPLSFKAEVYASEENIIRLNVLWINPLKTELTDARFRLISIDGKFQLKAG